MSQVTRKNSQTSTLRCKQGSVPSSASPLQSSWSSSSLTEKPLPPSPPPTTPMTEWWPSSPLVAPALWSHASHAQSQLCLSHTSLDDSDSESEHAATDACSLLTEVSTTPSTANTAIRRITSLVAKSRRAMVSRDTSRAIGTFPSAASASLSASTSSSSSASTHSICSSNLSSRYPRLQSLWHRLSHMKARVTRQVTPKLSNTACPLPVPMSADWKQQQRVFSVDPQLLRFSLRYIPDSFADGPRLESLVRAVRRGLLSASAFTPLRVRRGADDQLYAVDCRRLYVLREANAASVTVVELPKAMTVEETARAGGPSIQLIRSQSTEDAVDCTETPVVTPDPANSIEQACAEIERLINDISELVANAGQ